MNTGRHDQMAWCLSFVAEPPGDVLQRNPEALADTRLYALNLAAWLGRDSERSSS